MTLATFALLFGAGVLGGCANAIAGGATLITFPAMVASGLPIVTANASNSVAVMPGNIIAALSDRAKWPAFDRHFAMLIALCVACGTLGAWLLISHSDRSFMRIVPALIGLATLLFALSPRLNAALARMRERGVHVPAATAPVLIGSAAVYGGYFGAGVGVMMMGLLSVIEARELRTLNAMKNLLCAFIAVPSLIVFVASGSVSWPQTLTMLAGAMAGGFLGARLIRIISAMAMRATVAAIGALMTAIYVYRYWM